MVTSITEKHFKNASTRLREKYLSMGKSLTHSQSLQELSDILFQKPYEEIKATILNSNGEKKNDNKNTVVILQAAEESILVVNGEYVAGDFPRTDMEMGYKNLWLMGQSIAKEKNTHLVHLPVPIYDIENFETDDVINRAEKMGLFNPEGSLLKTLLTKTDVIYMVNNIQNPYPMDGEWMEQVEEEGEDAIVWHMEMEKDYEKYEFYVTFKELCEAKKVDERTWIISNRINMNETCDIELKLYQ